MWTFINRAHLAVRRARAIVAVAIAALALMSTPSAAAVQDVKICSLYGAFFFYMPGTDTCVNANQTVADQFAIARAQTLASTGTAMAAALVNPFLPDGTNYAISGHWAVFNGQHAVGLVGMIRLKGNLAFSAGMAFGLDRGQLISLTNRTQTEFGTSFPEQAWSDVRALGRVGLQYSW
jgi:Porin subfamily